MRKVLIFSILVFLLFSGCKKAVEPEEEKQQKTVVLNGRVLEEATNAPIRNAVVRILGITPALITYTDSLGRYQFNFQIEVETELQIVAFKEGYEPDTSKVLALPGRKVDVPVLMLKRVVSEVPTSGEPASIVLVSQSAKNIGVKGSGSVETAQLVFEVQDSSGKPVDLAHSVEVSFRIGSGPGGGEFVHPPRARTDSKGRVTANVVSGTRAGVVQIVAEAVSGTRTIRSLPVVIVIHGGLPDSAHFSIAPDKLNFPGYNIFGLTNRITAYVGDKYGNPVKPGTAVYFTTTGGIIEGSVLTDNRGQGSVNLISAEPRPVHPVLGPGYAVVTATTADENQRTIKAETIVLFSGIPQVTVTPSTFSIPNLGSQIFNYTVSDQNGNPLAGGTTIKVSIDGKDIKALGDLDITLPDTRDRSWTRFSFAIQDTTGDDTPRPVLIRISTTGPNGSATVNISGTVR
ncbi:MAG: Ig-like domain-containing protein [Candidatus Kryptonium sp.]|nr:Ig-like domain-containing protein [Candidatus Kryptonium sp.]MCX7762490.1 Ig-like domain-containing protein [Candidatus Kryptonium sp.]MDW8109550.1 Ig-like domain-containing protein [Candidatus Kryptonium sp.]